MDDDRHESDVDIARLCNAYAALVEERQTINDRVQAELYAGNAEAGSDEASWEALEALQLRQLELVAVLASQDATTLAELRAEAAVLTQILDEEIGVEPANALSRAVARHVVRLLGE